ncbi:hypothetical protein K458DRAFT_169482 [Lentithecium fluviatile CBS 122367]|uniref:Heterokaryon incompatibility domain-containing protein n=1 Tax=Lentithecium fluviatile CBS 122367 TaxID=1168545 RepID=A0A6G1JBZ7_9PLEO|nr:hypothetical protein K458DRAFT_169482 [Lentithecium fluviatile CBS 122367]
MLRFREGVLDDRYISPYNGRTEELVVQTVDTIYNNSSSEGTWNRTFIRDISPWHLRLANWPESHIPYIERTEGQVTFWQNAFKAVKYVPAAIALVAVIAFPGNVEGEVRNGGRYDAFPYKFHGYSKVARNLLEERITRKRVNLGQKTQAIMTNRLLNPRKICLIDMEPSPRNPDGVKTIDYEEGMALPYLFAAYTAEQFPDWSDEHKEQMIRMAAKATRDHGLAAFWISSCCIDTSLDRRLANGKVIQEDVYRISDVIRGAEVTVILLGPPSTGNTEANNEERRLGERLRQWGSRLWTFPEVLLSTGDTIKVYNIGVPEPLIIHKNQFASLVWPDKDVSRQLIDHHQGTLKLSRLELVTIALECLFSRQHGTFLPGDHSYALMGLLRLRPQVDETDSGFQAFARLSLANDSDLLLERLSCVLPYNPDQPWHTMDDAYGASLWDIYPSCQIAGIGDDNTIIVDGARGANVRWKSFASVHVLRRWSWKRLLFRMLLHTSSMALLVGAILLWIADWIHMKERKAAGTLMSPFSALGDFEVPGFGDLGIHEVLKNLENDALDIIQDIVRIVVDADVIKSFGVIFMIWALSMAVFAPVAIRTLYGGKLWNTQPWLFGFEGYLSITQIEHLIFGDERNRLRWHPSGSPLSRHQVDDSWKGGHCEPVDPTTDPAVKTMVEAAKTSKLGDQKIFTLVDTNTMTVTMFQAARPPVCFLLLGAEGGMQRAVGCSFDWTTGILYRETVLRMETSCRDKMDLVSRARISLEKRRNPGVQQAPQRPRYKVTASSEKFARRTETESG